MKIIADENIPFVREAFSTLGEVTALPGREITAKNLGDAEVLLVRSVTRVGPELLSGSNVKFVATATIGYDHLDVDYLKKEGIEFASAPGSNANSVAEYVLSALFVLAERGDFNLAKKVVGIVGCGNVGSNLLAKLRALDVTCLVNDPSLKEQTGGTDFAELEEILSTDIITLHVPLEYSGRYPTYHLVNEAFLSRMKKGTILINTSRGSVVDEIALRQALEVGEISAVLDVWEHEPDINIELLGKVAIGTPHIAGYSFDGKVRGTEMIYEAACKFFGVTPNWSAQDHLPNPVIKRMMFSNTVADPDVIRSAILACYDVRADDASMRGILTKPHPDRGRYFESLRKNYPVRREFTSTEIRISKERQDLAKQLEGMGFRVKFNLAGF